MIEITHRQAQRLIREAQDRPLDDAPWAMLQAHMETCETCRAYEQHLLQYDHTLRRALRNRWANSNGPSKVTVSIEGQPTALALYRWVPWHLEMRRQRRLTIRRMMGRILPWVTIFLILSAFIAYRQLTRPSFAQLPSPTATRFGAPPDATALAATQIVQTLQPIENTFQGVVLYTSAQSGNSEIYLMTASPVGTEFANFTQNAAEDTDPAWSPDGEWIAFLSNRTNRKEVFVQSVAGSQPMQITNDPRIAWQGPIQWTSDGSTLVLRGIRVDMQMGSNPDSSWLYKVPIDGGALAAIATTSGAGAIYRTSPQSPVLVFQSTPDSGMLRYIDLQSGWNGWIAQQNNDVSYRLIANTNPFNWLFGGRQIVYLTRDSAAGDEVRISQEIDERFAGIQPISRRVADFPSRSIHAVTDVPNSLQVAVLENLKPTGQKPCWTVSLKNAYTADTTENILTGLCVDGDFSRENWSSDGKWLVVRAHPDDDKSVVGLYSMRIPDEMARSGAISHTASPAQKLADLPYVEPRIRPNGTNLHIQPQRAVIIESHPKPADTLGLLTAPILYSAPGNTNAIGQQIFRVDTDGSDPVALTVLGTDADCPRYAPEGPLAAFRGRTSQMRFAEIYLLNLTSAESHALTETSSALFPNANPDTIKQASYDCPVWSPDGSQLAAVLRMGSRAYLTLIPVNAKNAGEGVQYVPISIPSRFSAPVWVRKPQQPLHSPSNAILLIFPRLGQSAELAIVNLPTAQDDQPPEIEHLLQPFDGWDDVENLSMDPEGYAIAGLALKYTNPSTRTGDILAQLRTFQSDTYTVTGQLIQPYLYLTAGQGALNILPNSQIAWIQTLSLTGPQKTFFRQFTIKDGGLTVPQELGSFPDMVYHVAWKDYRYAVMASESGLYEMDWQANPPTPVRILPTRVTDVDWR